MTSRIVFSEAAREDRRDITGYTVERFGIGQARRLRDRFQQVLTTLADNPQMGLSRTELDPRGYSFRYFVVMNTFLVVYRPISDGIALPKHSRARIDARPLVYDSLVSVSSAAPTYSPLCAGLFARLFAGRILYRPPPEATRPLMS